YDSASCGRIAAVAGHAARVFAGLAMIPVGRFPSLLAAGTLLLAVLATPVRAQTATTPGAISLPEPTLNHLSIEWAISGDSDADGVVGVRYRPLGSGVWRPAMPLRRVPAASNSTGAGDVDGSSWSNRHSGSLFGLQPGTTYQIELSLSDPDGGGTQQIVQATTRSVPQPGGGSVRAATPGNLASVINQAQPGDIVELGAGTYA